MTTKTETVLDVIHSCRAMRRLETQDVPDDLVEELIDAAIRAPSGCNTQDQRFVVVRDPGMKRALAERVRMSIRWMKSVLDVRSNTLRASGALSEEEHAAYVRTWKAVEYLAEHFEDSPVVIAACVEPDEPLDAATRSGAALKAAVAEYGVAGALRFMASAGRLSDRGDCADIYPAIQNLLLAARALGLGATMTTPQIMGPPGDVEKILGLPKGVMLAGLIPVGYPRGRFGPVSRKPLEEFIYYDTYGNKTA